MSFDLASWAKRVTRAAADSMPTGTLSLSPRQQALFYAAAVGLGDLGDIADGEVAAARRLSAAVDALTGLEREIEQTCLRFCANQQCTPAIPLFLMVQVMLNIRDGFGCNIDSWLPYLNARLQGATLCS